MRTGTTIMVVIAAFLIWSLTAAEGLAASSIKQDEEVVLFPTTAHLDQNDKTWIIPVHGWIFEREKDSIWREAVIEGLLKRLELDSNVIDHEVFRKRARMFLVDNERGKRLRVRIGNRLFLLSRSKANGHFKDLFRVDAKALEKGVRNRWLSYWAVMPEGDDRRFEGRVQLLPREGVSVISDIDDTIKMSDVLNKQELLANTFFRSFRAVRGMAELYRRWSKAGAAFHYVSSSPWQLYPSLSGFMQEHGFPPGSFHLKLFRMKDQTFFKLFASPEVTKPPVIESILNKYPGRKLVLVGDSTEKDPEIYGAIARQYPKQVIHIFIRNLSRGSTTSCRFRVAFQGVSRKRWTLFRDPHELLELELGDKEGAGTHFISISVNPAGAS